ncbi:MAG: hypothetical protein NZ556_02235, partial [Fimbriimonadales bacterium]|nr:hypothetical protein [Fimbriimonadales bacterium]
MKRLLSASLALALGLQFATAQSSRVFVLEGLYTEFPSVDVSSSGLWLAALDVKRPGSGSLTFADSAKIWNLLTGEVYRASNDSPTGLSMLRFVPGTDDLAILGRWSHLTVYRPVQFLGWRWLPLARFYVGGIAFDVAPQFNAAAVVDPVGRVFVLRGLRVDVLGNTAYSFYDTHVAFSPDGALLAVAYRSGSLSSTVRLYRVSDLSVIWERQTPFVCRGIAYAPNGRYLAATGAEGQIRLWDLQTNLLWDVEARFVPVATLRFSPDSTLLATGEGGQDEVARLWRVPDLAPVSTIPVGYAPLSLAFHPTQNVLYTAGFGGMLDAWSLSEPNEGQMLARRWTLWGFRRGARELWVSDTQFTYAYNEQGQVVQRVPLGAVQPDSYGGILALSPDRQWAATAQGVVRLQTGQNVLNQLIREATFSPDSSKLAILDPYGYTRVYDTRTWQLLWQQFIVSARYVFSADGARLLTEDGNIPGAVRVHNASTGQVLWESSVGERASLSPDGRYVALRVSTSAGARLRVYRVNDNTLVHESPYGSVHSYAFAPNSRYMVVGAQSTHYGYDLQTNTVLWEEAYDELPTLSAANFTPDSRYVVLRAGEQPVVVDMHSGTPVGSLGSDRPFAWLSATYSDDGTRIALFYEDRTVVVARHVPIEGDVNGDGCVDDADLLSVLFQFGQSGSEADLNKDGTVDDADLL